MNTKLILIGILLLASLTMAGCVWYGGHGDYGHFHDHGYGDHGDWDRGHHGSEHGSHYWR